MGGRIFVSFCLLLNFFHFNIGLNIDQEELLKLQEAIEDLRFQFGQDNVTLTENEQILKKVIDEIPSTTARGPEIQEGPFYCAICMGFSNLALYLRRVARYDDKRAEEFSLFVCNWLRIQNGEVCRGVLRYNVPPILFIIDNHRNLTADTICKIMLDKGRCSQKPTGSAAENLEFIVNIDGGNIGRKDSLENSVEVAVADVIEEEEATQEESLTIIQITDIHYDPDYSEGSPADCGIYACCRNMSTTPARSKAAGYWGDYSKCDTPWRAIVDAFQKIKNTFNVREDIPGVK